MRCVIRNHQDWVSRFHSQRDIDIAAAGGINPANQRKWFIGPLVFLYASIVDRLEQCESTRSADHRPGLEVDVRTVVVSSDDSRPADDWLRADDCQNHRAVAIIDDQSR